MNEFDPQWRELSACSDLTIEDAAKDFAGNVCLSCPVKRECVETYPTNPEHRIYRLALDRSVLFMPEDNVSEPVENLEL